MEELQRKVAKKSRTYSSEKNVYLGPIDFSATLSSRMKCLWLATSVIISIFDLIPILLGYKWRFDNRYCSTLGAKTGKMEEPVNSILYNFRALLDLLFKKCV